MTAESVRSDAAVRGTAGPHPDLCGRACRDLLLLDLGRPHGEHPVLVRGRAQQAVAGGRARPLRRPLAVPPLAHVLHHRAAHAGPGRPRQLPAAEGAQARHLTARREGRGDRQQADPPRSAARPSGRGSGCATPGCASRVSELRSQPPERAGRGVGRAPRARESRGSFAPAPRTRRLSVERREAGHWRRVGAVRTWAGGRYRTAVAAARRVPGAGGRGGRAGRPGPLT